MKTGRESELESEIKRLRDVCSEMYQVAGALDAPPNVLDQLLAAADGEPMPYETLLPFSVTEESPTP
jgi:hypothetical protein